MIGVVDLSLAITLTSQACARVPNSTSKHLPKAVRFTGQIVLFVSDIFPRNKSCSHIIADKSLKVTINSNKPAYRMFNDNMQV